MDIVTDLKYAGDDQCRLDLYIPRGRPGRPPVVLVVHGGAWMFGDKAGVQYCCLQLVQHGFMAAACNYRLRTLPAGAMRQSLWWTTVLGTLALGIVRPMWCVLFLSVMCVAWIAFWILQESDVHHTQDVDRALDWVREQVHRFGGDHDQVFLLGHSAGAHLVCMAANRRATQEGDATQAWWLRGVVGISGVYSAKRLHDMTCGDWLMRAAFGRQDDYVQQFPLGKVHSKLPPHLLLNATYDLKLSRHTWDLAVTLRSHGVWVQAASFPGTHFSIMHDWSGYNRLVWQTIHRFFIQAYAPSLPRGC